MNLLLGNMLGRLNLEAFQHDKVAMGGVIGMTLGTLAAIALLTYTKRWKWLWRIAII